METGVKENELESFVTYHGIVSGDKKRDLLKQCDIFALPTRYPNEGQPISILEAMGNGMVILTTNHAGIPDIVKNGVNGIVVQSDRIDVQQCYDFLLFKLSEDMKKIVKKNRITVKEIYNEDKYISNMEKILRKI